MTAAATHGPNTKTLQTVQQYEYNLYPGLLNNDRQHRQIATVGTAKECTRCSSNCLVEFELQALNRRVHNPSVEELYLRI